MSARALTGCYLGLWAATLVGAALTLTGAELWHVDAPRPALDAAPGTAGELLANNTLVALWPLALILLGWPALPGVRNVGDAVITAQLLGHGLLVGSAVGQHPGLWRYLPHLPLEWLALAIPAAAWQTARRSDRRTRATADARSRRGGPAPAGTTFPAHPSTPPPPAVRRIAPVTVAALCVLAGAAMIETYLAPI